MERKIFWPTLGSDVRKYVNSCHQCQINKATNQRPAGLLQPLPIPCEPWESVSMDFIIQLPVIKEGHDFMFVVVDRLTKIRGPHCHKQQCACAACLKCACAVCLQYACAACFKCACAVPVQCLLAYRLVDKYLSTTV